MQETNNNGEITNKLYCSRPSGDSPDVELKLKFNKCHLTGVVIHESSLPLVNQREMLQHMKFGEINISRREEVTMNIN